MITIHFGDVESILLFTALALWGLSKVIEAYFRGRIKELQKKLDKESE